MARIDEADEMGKDEICMENPIFSINDDDDPNPIVHLTDRPNNIQQLSKIDETEERVENLDTHQMSTFGHQGTPIDFERLREIDFEGNLRLGEALEGIDDESDEMEKVEEKTRPNTIRRFFSQSGPFKPKANRLSSRQIEERDLEKTRKKLTKSWVNSSIFRKHTDEEEPVEAANLSMDPPPRFKDLENEENPGLRAANSEQASSQLEEPPWDHSPSETRWINNKEAKSSMMTALTAFYCLFITIFALVLELSHLLSGDEERKMNPKDWIFGLYMYGCGIIFFIYMYSVLLLNPRWFSSIGGIKRLFGLKKIADSGESSSTSSANSEAATIRMVSHTSPSAGSLFLRLGCVAFGVIGLVFNSFLVFLCLSSDSSCSRLQASLDICAIIFIFIQMHFIFCNSKLSISGSHTIARLGTMHLIAANLWTWVRYILMEEGVMEKEIRETFKNKKLGNKTSSAEEEEHHGKPGKILLNTLIANYDTDKCRAAECILGSLSEVMYTAIVEYSLIGAAVMFIVWRNIGRHYNSSGQYVKRKHQIRVDCSKTTTGLFLGLAFLATSFTSMVVYYGLSSMNEKKKAAYVYAITDIIQYIFSSIGCGIAIYQMRKLQYYSNVEKESNKSDKAHTELLDQILLSLGLVGELIYSVAGLVGLTGDRHWVALAFVLLVVHICRILQVGLQTFLLYMAGRVRVSGADRVSQPGKQAVTFLLVANLALFLMNLFESEKAGVSDIITDFYGKRSWVFLVRSFSPLTIFYRFHSSVCLAEIWKNVYARKD
ncbi:unnamed protein product, partial [Mesorhabditis belari]|uniref:Uncharacterized protein n=1 Tax=Mesorhabditis belari TaxID=2138241 RepID=A0AAF3FJ09_9BILA